MIDTAGPHPPTGLRVLVVDDELPALAELSSLLEQDERIDQVRTACGGADALRALDAAPTDVLFCDIRMPGLDGTELARVLGRFVEPPQIVFVTACEDHALAAFDVDATDHLVKPVRADRLAEAVGRVVVRPRPGPPSRRPSDPSRPAPDLRAAAASAPDLTISVELAGVTTFVRRSQVRYVRAQGDYARLYTATGSHLVRLSLTHLEQDWAEAGFARIHRSTLVFLPAVTAVRTDNGRCVVVLGDTELQVSRRHTRDLRERLLHLPRRDPC